MQNVGVGLLSLEDVPAALLRGIGTQAGAMVRPLRWIGTVTNNKTSSSFAHYIACLRNCQFSVESVL